MCACQCVPPRVNVNVDTCVCGHRHMNPCEGRNFDTSPWVGVCLCVMFTSVHGCQHPWGVCPCRCILSRSCMSVGKVCVNVCMCTQLYGGMCVNVCTCVWVYVYADARIPVCTCLNMCSHMCLCVEMCTPVCVAGDMYIYVSANAHLSLSCVSVGSVCFSTCIHVCGLSVH